MWTIPLCFVQSALRRKAAEVKASAILRRSLSMAGGDAAMREAVFDVFYAGENRAIARSIFDPHAISERA